MPDYSQAKYDVVNLERASIKPGVSVLLPVSLIAWGSCAGFYSAFRVLICDQLLILAVLAFIFVLAGLIAWLKFRHRAILWAASFFLGILLAAYGAYQIQFASENYTGDTQTWTFTLNEDAQSSQYGSTCSASAVSESGLKTYVKLNFSDEVELKQGEIIRASISLRKPPTKSSEYYWSSGLSSYANIETFEDVSEPMLLSFIYSIRNKAIENFATYGGDQAGILQALVCGYRNTIEDNGNYDKYKIVGLAHIVAVSGAHLAIVTMLFGWVLTKLRVPRSLYIAALVSFVLIYLVFSGVPISALRAAFMVVLSLSSYFANRRGMSMNSLAVCVIVFIAARPSVSVSPSFVLSASSTLGIILFSGLICSWAQNVSKKIKSFLVEPLSLTLSANIMTLPYSAALFSQLSLVAPIANVLATPLFAIACTCGLVAAIIAAVFPSLAGLSICIATLCVTPLSALVDIMSAFPYACIATSLLVVPMVVLSVCAALALWIIWPKLTLKSMFFGALSYVVLAACAIIASPYLHGDEIVMLNVGQGDAILLRSGGSSVLIDTGNQDSMLRSELGEQGVYSLDAVIITHHDDDHMESLENLATYENVGAVYSASDALTCACDSCANLRDVSSGVVASGLLGLSVKDSISFGNFTLLVVWPESYTDEGGNADSLCLLLRADCNGDGTAEWQALLTGDAESDELSKILESDAVGDIDILKVGHHGSKVSLTDKVAQELSPEISLISVGANNSYGHPTEEALETLRGVDSQVYRTDENGTIKISFSVESLYVETDI